MSISPIRSRWALVVLGLALVQSGVATAVPSLPPSPFDILGLRALESPPLDGTLHHSSGQQALDHEGAELPPLRTDRFISPETLENAQLDLWG